MPSKESEMFVVILVAAILCIGLSFGFGYYKGLSDSITKTHSIPD